MENTRIQFGEAGDQRASASKDAETIVPHSVGCPTCGQHFSGVDARFCPFDGEKLEPAPDWDPGADPLIGSVIDRRYEVLGVLGEGGMGIVYRVRHATLGRHFALKALRRDLARDKELSARFIQEARAAASVSHPSVVQITDFGELPSGQAYFVMELLAGYPLSWVIKRGGSIPAARAVRILRQIAEALGAAHDAGIVHRDLKPDNINISEVIGDRDVVKVLDFGLAKIAGASKLTRAGMVFGTPHYMSPEQAAGEPVDHRADIYALGVVMYEMFAGRVPFEADSYMGVLTKHMYVAPTPPSQLIEAPRELGALEDITLRCLEKKPANRYGAMSELLDELDRIVSFNDDGELDVPPSRAGDRPSVRSVLADELEAPSPEEVRVARRRAGAMTHGLPSWLLPAAAGAGLLFIALVVLVLAVARRGSGPPPEPPMATPIRADEAPRMPVLAAPKPPPPGPEATPVTEPALPPPRAKKARAAKPGRHSTFQVSVPPGKGAVPAAGPSAARPGKKPPRTAVGAGEIVDPWAE